MTNLFEMDPTRRFSSRADDYARFRPDYPDDAIRRILAGLGKPEDLVVVDLGAGTGISSRRLASHGVRVIAIEPNEEMRRLAAPHPRVEFREGTAESIPFADSSVDLLAAFQAFHWFRPEPALREFHRVLKPGGRMAVVWNERNNRDSFTREYGRLIREASGNHPAERRELTVDAFINSKLFTDVHHQTFRYEQELSLDELIGRTRSASYIPSEGPAADTLMSELKSLHERWLDDASRVTLVYRTEVYYARPARE